MVHFYLDVIFLLASFDWPEGYSPFCTEYYTQRGNKFDFSKVLGGVQT